MKSAGLKGSLLWQARLARRGLRRFRQAWRYGPQTLRATPVLFANSFPKSGTHLLTQVMAGFTRLGPAVESGLPAIVTFRGDSGAGRSEAEILGDLQRLLPGDLGYGHVHAFPGALSLLSQPGWAAFFILRDPRDVVVSHVHYVTDMAPRHALHAYYQSLPDFDARLATSIAGWEGAQVPGEAEALLPDIRQRFEPYLGWLDCQAVLTLHYEEFLTDWPAAAGAAYPLGKVLDHAVQRGFPLRVERQAAIEILAGSIHPQRSPTFRRGKAGGWREAFQPQHTELFKSITGDLLIRLGYEHDENW